MKSTVLALLCLAIACGAHAQVRKCTMPDGKVVYSDVICTDIAAKESKVNTKANVFDGSSVRAQAAKSEAAAASEAAAIQRQATAAATQTKPKAAADDPCPMAAGQPSLSGSQTRLACLERQNKENLKR